MSEYCKLWHLTFNTEKTKVVVFSRGKLRNKPAFYFNSAPLEAIDNFSYLEQKFKFHSKLNKTKKHLTDLARKTMFNILTKIKKYKTLFAN
jgi:competence CoiA-like predicted nuclease